jgi:hypothetical protein
LGEILLGWSKANYFYLFNLLVSIPHSSNLKKLMRMMMLAKNITLNDTQNRIFLAQLWHLLKLAPVLPVPFFNFTAQSLNGDRTGKKLPTAASGN